MGNLPSKFQGNWPRIDGEMSKIVLKMQKGGPLSQVFDGMSEKMRNWSNGRGAYMSI